MDGKEFPVAIDVTGLEPNTDYQVVLHSFNFGGKEVETAPVSFKTKLAVPAVQTRSATEVKNTSAVLNGKVNPHNSAVDLSVRMGPRQDLRQLRSCSARIAGQRRQLLPPSRTADHRTPGRHRLPLPAVGDEHLLRGARPTAKTSTFRTSPAEVCPNEQVRVEVNSLALPECRAYEMVTPIEKSGNDAGFPGATRRRLLVRQPPTATPSSSTPVARWKATQNPACRHTSPSRRREPNGWATEGAIPRGDPSRTSTRSPTTPGACSSPRI